MSYSYSPLPTQRISFFWVKIEEGTIKLTKQASLPTIDKCHQFTPPCPHQSQSKWLAPNEAHVAEQPIHVQVW